MQWPQIVVIVLLTLHVAFSLSMHGKARAPYHFGYSIARTVLWVFVLRAGGFF